MDTIDTGLLMLRLLLGLTMVAHGYGKFFRGGRISGTASWFDGMGMRPGRVHAWLAGLTEVGAGIALALGMFTPFAVTGFVALMFVAAWTVHRGKGFFVAADGWEYNLVLAGGAVIVAIMGAGKVSLDRLIFGGDMLDGWVGGAIALAGGLTAAGVLLGMCYRPASEQGDESIARP